ncbi:MAG: Rrf2 family transcriptional regulator [candidate division Zixibacteria bacterium]|nr:Rrf2 family transcriptional regulator [candidate division Zixibacteria bacterium]
MGLHLSKALVYALHALDYMHEKGAERPVMVREICEKYSFSYDTVLSVLRRLSRGKLLTTHRGIKGGFSLRYPLKSISLLTLVETLEGPVESIDPLQTGVGNTRVKRAVVKNATKINDAFRKHLQSTSCLKMIGS